MPGVYAEYEVLIPKVDNLGNPLKDLGRYAYNHLVSQIEIQKGHVDPNRRVFWQGREEPFDVLIFLAQDEPQTDSTVKQLAAYLGEVANQEVLLVTKHGKQGITPWPIRNPMYQPDHAANSTFLSSPPVTDTTPTEI